jgi:hypothetical protein
MTVKTASICSGEAGLGRSEKLCPVPLFTFIPYFKCDQMRILVVADDKKIASS